MCVQDGTYCQVRVHIKSSNSHITDRRASIFAKYNNKTKEVLLQLCFFSRTQAQVETATSKVCMHWPSSEPGIVHCSTNEEKLQQLAMCLLVGYLRSSTSVYPTFQWGGRNYDYWLVWNQIYPHFWSCFCSRAVDHSGYSFKHGGQSESRGVDLHYS